MCVADCICPITQNPSCVDKKFEMCISRHVTQHPLIEDRTIRREELMCFEPRSQNTGGPREGNTQIYITDAFILFLSAGYALRVRTSGYAVPATLGILSGLYLRLPATLGILSGLYLRLPATLGILSGPIPLPQVSLAVPYPGYRGDYLVCPGMARTSEGRPLA